MRRDAPPRLRPPRRDRRGHAVGRRTARGDVRPAVHRRPRRRRHRRRRGSPPTSASRAIASPSVGAPPGPPRPRRVDASGLVVAPGLHRHARPVRVLGAARPPRRQQGDAGHHHRAHRRGQLHRGEPSRRAAICIPSRRCSIAKACPPGTISPATCRCSTHGRPTINLGTFVSAGGVREAVIGREDRAATAAELAAMEAQVAAAMEAGAFGLSTSLQYVPDRFARTDELVALARVAGRYGGSYITHQRSEADAIDDSLDEVFRIAREARRAGDRPSPEDRLPAELGPDAAGAGADRAGPGRGARHRRRSVSLRRRQQPARRQPAGVGARGRARRRWWRG